VRLYSALTLTAFLMLLQGCATVTNPDPKDPLQGLNRSVFDFNEGADHYVLKPASTAYRDITPEWTQKGIHNFFNNLQDAWSGVNTLLQGKREETGDNFGRVIVNSSIGLLGFMDVASDLKIARHTTSFGSTIGHWGVAPGPYVVLPLLGPFTLREVAVLPVDLKGNVIYQVGDASVRNGLTVLQTIDTRTYLLSAGNVVDGAALDKYSFIRDAFLARQRNNDYDGNPPDEDNPDGP